METKESKQLKEDELQDVSGGTSDKLKNIGDYAFKGSASGIRAGISDREVLDLAEIDELLHNVDSFH